MRDLDVHAPAATARRRPGGAAAAALPADAIMALQRMAGNRAVARMLAGAAGGRRLQRLTFEKPEWERAAAGRRVGGVPGQGVLGIVIVEDREAGEPPLVIKPLGPDSPVESTVTARLVTQFGRKRGISAPSQRQAEGDEIASILAILYRNTTGWVPDPQPGGRMTRDQKMFLEQTEERPPLVMGLATGRTMGAMARAGEGADLLSDPSYMRKLGVMTAVDWFLGYGDRISPVASNLGNWLTSVDAKHGAAIAAVDNFDLQGAQRFDERKHRTWVNEFGPYFAALESTAAEAVQKLRLEYLRTRLGRPLQDADQALLGPEARMAQAFLEGLKAGRKRILDKLAPHLGRPKRRGVEKTIFIEGLGSEGWEWALKRVEALRQLA